MRILIFLLFCLTGCNGDYNQTVKQFTVESPKPFGYVIGDVIPRRIIIETHSDSALQASSLPAVGVINRWLNLNDVTVRHTGKHYEIDLLYQVFYAPLEVKMLTIPGFSFLLSDGENSVSQTVPEWSFTISPLRELAVRKSGDSEYMRPDAMPLPLSNRPAKYGLYASLTFSFVSASYLGYLYGYFPTWSRRNLFKQTLKRVEGLSKADMATALTLVHQTLNNLYRKPLFHNRLNHFFQLNPEYQQLHKELDWFFNFSNRYFFTNGMIVVQHDMEKLKELCKEFRKIERGSQ